MSGQQGRAGPSGGSGLRVTLDPLQYVRTNDAFIGTPQASLRVQVAMAKVLFEPANVQQTFDDLARDLKQIADEVKTK